MMMMMCCVVVLLFFSISFFHSLLFSRKFGFLTFDDEGLGLIPFITFQPILFFPFQFSFFIFFIHVFTCMAFNF
jgi:hypothetical protein